MAALETVIVVAGVVNMVATGIDAAKTAYDAYQFAEEVGNGISEKIMGKSEEIEKAQALNVDKSVAPEATMGVNATALANQPKTSEPMLQC